MWQLRSKSILYILLQICSLLRGGIAERGGVRVGHRIIEINNQSVVAVPHDTIVKLLSSSVGEVIYKTNVKSQQLIKYSTFFLPDLNENDADVHVSFAHRPGDTNLYLIKVLLMLCSCTSLGTLRTH